MVDRCCFHFFFDGTDFESDEAGSAELDDRDDCADVCEVAPVAAVFAVVIVVGGGGLCSVAKHRMSSCGIECEVRRRL